MAKKKRKLSVYNLHIKRETKKGRSFMQAVRSWGGGKLKTRRRAVKRKVTPMVRRRVRRVYARARGGVVRYRRAGGGTLMRGLVPVPKLLSSALLGAGAAAIQRRFLPQKIPYQGAAIGFVLGGAPGAVGAFISEMLLGGGAAQTSYGGNY